MSVQQQVISILADVLQLDPGLVGSMGAHTTLLGAMPEFDSIAVVSVLTALEEQYGFFVEDDEIVAEVFESVDTLVTFVTQKLNA